MTRCTRCRAERAVNDAGFCTGCSHPVNYTQPPLISRLRSFGIPLMNEAADQIERLTSERKDQSNG